MPSEHSGGTTIADHGTTPARIGTKPARSWHETDTNLARDGHEPGTRQARSRHKAGTERAQLVWHRRGMEFAPPIDPRLRASVGRIVDLRSSASVWRELRRRALRLGTTTPCYESVRKLVVAERERRARLLAALTTMLEIAARRVPVLPEQVPRIYRRRLALSRAAMGNKRIGERRGPPLGGPRSR
jgi:hypothetical protein